MQTVCEAVTKGTVVWGAETNERQEEKRPDNIYGTSYRNAHCTVTSSE